MDRLKRISSGEAIRKANAEFDKLVYQCCVRYTMLGIMEMKELRGGG